MREIEIIDRNKLVDVIQKHQENAEWEYREESQFWNGASKLIYERLYNGLVYPDGKVVPPPVIVFDNLRNQNTLACYDLYPDEYGMIGKITFNTQWYEKRDGKMVWKLGRYSQLETLDHESIHLNQQIGRGLDPYNPRKHGRVTHNKEFHKIAHGHGLQTRGPYGIHEKPAIPGSPIDIIARDLLISRPNAENKPDDDKSGWAYWLIDTGGGERRKGRSSLTKWNCPECGLNLRVGVKTDIEVACMPCSRKEGDTVLFIRG